MPNDQRPTGTMHLAILAHARRHGWTVRRLPGVERLVEVRKGTKRGMVLDSSISLNTASSARFARNKHLSSILLAHAGVPVPAQRLCRTAMDGARAAEQIGYPVVVKPIRGHGGDGITLDIRTRRALTSAVRYAQRQGLAFVVEAYLPGVDLRVLVLDGRVIGAAERRPPCAIADGRRNVETLLADFEALRAVKLGAIAPLRRVLRDGAFDRTLRAQGYTLRSVPAAGVVVTFRNSSDLSKGGTSHTRSRLPAGVRDAAIRAARAVGLRRAGVDFLLQPTGSKPRFVVNEINGNPAFPLHHHPDEGAPQDVLTPLLNALGSA